MRFPKPEFADRLIGRDQAAQILDVSSRTLLNWQERGFGPYAIQAGGVSVYDRAQVEAFRALAPEAA